MLVFTLTVMCLLVNMERIYDKSFIYILITISSLTVSEQSNCEVQSSLPPDPATGCCGHDTSGIQRVEDLLDLQTANSYRRFSNKSATFENGIIPSRRITAGTETEYKQFPWMVFVETLFDSVDKKNRTLFSCGGSLISSRYVLTAAHCLQSDGMTFYGTRVTLANYNLNTFPKDCNYIMGEEHCAENILIYGEDAVYHPNFFRRRIYHDIGLIRLCEPAPYTDFIRPICLPTFDIDHPEFANLPLQIAGWGKTHEQEPTSVVNLQAVINLVPKSECRNIYNNVYKFPILNSQFCAIGSNGQDTCDGDSGGPVMLLYKGTYYLVGIIIGKTNKSTCGSSVPSLFTNVYQFRAWINMHLRM